MEFKPQFGLESPTSILAWSEDTFGSRTAQQIAVRASREVNELVSAILNGGTLESIYEELGDCAIMLWQVAHRLGIKPRPEIFRTAALMSVSKELLVLRLQRRLTTFLEETYMFGEQVSADVILTDVLRILEALVAVYNVEITEIVDTKMGVNRERNWKQLSDGSYQHATPGSYVEAEAVQ